MPFLTLLSIVVVGVLIPNAPLYRKIPSRDSGVFLYIGEQILDGKIPYRSVWDHKPPVIHYINALGLFIGRGSIWGVWFLEFLALYLAGALGFALIKQVLGIVPAIFGTISWLMSLVLVLEGGNFAEEFALPFQFAAIYLFWQSEERGCYSWRGFLIGVIAAISFLLRPNLMGVPLSILFFLLLTRVSLCRWRSLFLDLAAILLGAMSVIFVFVIYFAHHNALGSLWDAVFKYNLAYSTTTPESRLGVLVTGLIMMSSSGISILVLTTWSAGIFHVWRDKSKIRGRKALLCMSLVDLLVEFFLVAFLGRSYRHYYIIWLPIFAVWAGFFAHVFTTRFFSHLRVIFRVPRATFANLWLFALLCIMSCLPVTLLIDQIIDPVDGRESTGYQTVKYIESSTTASDYVLIWGAETGINFVSHRQSPTRFVYQYPLYTRYYQSAAMVRELLDDIVMGKPALIVDTSSSNKIIPPIAPAAREKWISADANYGVLPEMDEVFEYIVSNYRLAEKIGQEQWLIYVYAGKR